MVMNETGQIPVIGQQINPEEPISFTANWNWTGYYGGEDITALDAFADVLDNLVAVKAYQGALLSTPWGWIDGVGEMEIDIGYLVKMTIEDTLVWPGSGQLSRIEGNVYTPSGMPSSYFSFDRTLNYEVMVCQIHDQNGILPSGSEIGLFSHDRCVGAEVYDGTPVLQLQAWEDNAFTEEIDGFIDGDTIEVRIWNGLDETVIPVQYVVDIPAWDHSGTFSSDAVTGFEINTVSLAIDNEALPDRIMLYDNYPNPFNPVTRIKYALPYNSFVEVSVYDILGQTVRVLVSGMVPAGYHQVIWSGDNKYGHSLPSGIYLYQLHVDKTLMDTRKMLLVK